MFLEKTYRILAWVVLCILQYSCTEPFPIVTKGFETVLVVQATLTDENIQHKVLLSRSYNLEGDGPNFESNAKVMIKDDAQYVYDFPETDPGTYVSSQAFAAQPGHSYQLFIETADGRSYSSDSEPLPQQVPIDRIYTEIETNVDQVVGAGFFVDNHDASGQSKYFRYTYEETYEIIAPYWVREDIYIVSDQFPYQVDVKLKTQEEHYCYKTNLSNNIVLANTSDYAENRISRFQVRFIAKDDYMLRNRYSILVHQYTQSLEAHNYLKTLKEFSGSENPFSENQPGFIEGNITSDHDTNEKVVGFFEVSSVSSKRIFVKFRDIFPTGNFPDFPYGCQSNAISLYGRVPQGPSPLIDAIESGQYKMYTPAPTPPDPPTVYIMVGRPCGDCTFMGSNKKPDFWVDEKI
ncbi:DUF4249 domain-containing protein [Flavobacteriaceae bacterium F89]|uniref:DUF4249 domain-containing protein n=1 Tax=Cerina litoralis TaxID=2874477 RepID=A0AAE3EYB4_9FLAO|nr:DUF4249 domain-containing protein [Cerina litoralis]MCG2461981.1 DUF4249 domain-containing protein [Cerina litoralis]